MKVLPSIFVTATAIGLVAGPASAQDAFAGTGQGPGQSSVEERNEALSESIEEDFERDIDRFGNEGRELGFTGSMALRGSATDGNDETVDIGIGANFGYFDGVNGYELGLSYSYAESENDDGDTETDEDSLLYDLEYTRSFNPRLYGFAKLQGSYQGDDDDGTDAERENDVFVGFGAGYRIYDTPDLQWSVQAGPGYRFASFTDVASTVTDFDDDDVSEAAFAVSSNFYNRFTDTVFLTNDTDIITSSSDTVLYNDLGLNVAMNDSLALRTSLQTEYHTDPVPGEESTDNALGVSLVYSFN